MELSKISTKGKIIIAREIRTRDILDELADDESNEVRWNVVQNNYTRKSTLLKLLGDADKTVRNGAEEALKQRFIN